MKSFVLLLLLASNWAFSQDNHIRLKKVKELNRIAFGSCNDQNDPQPLWKDVIQQKPDLWIWAGDNIYADTQDEEKIKLAYTHQNQHPDYQKMKSLIPIIGTWDDHDFGYDNATGDFAFKRESQNHALDFLEEPFDSPRRSQEGIYTSYEFGEEQRKIKVILLDNRYFKDVDRDYPMLGKAQWEWLEKELTNSDAKLHFIVTGLPVLSPKIPMSDNWVETSELNRMLNLLERTNPQGVVFLTGDKHFSSMYQRWGHLEFMSSGMTHVIPRNTWWYLGMRYPKTYFGLSYGQIDINWEENSPLLTMSIRSQHHQDIHRSKYRLENNKWMKLSKKPRGKTSLLP